MLLIFLPECSQGKHSLRLLTFCDLAGDRQYDIEYDADQLFYVDPVTYRMVPRLPEFAGQWTPDPGLAKEAYTSLGTCIYNIPRAIKGEKGPPVVIVGPTALIYPKQDMELGLPNTLVCFVNDFHPPVVDIAWTRNGQLVDQSQVSQTQYYSNRDFSFRTSSYLDFTPQEGDIYACSVGHISLQAPLTRFLDGYVFQMTYECEYGDDIKDVVFLVKNVFNMKLNTMYDSRVGKYVGFGEYGMKNADHYNGQAWKMALRRVQVETVCRYNARLFRGSTLDRKVPPVVRVRQTRPADYGVLTVLECSVVGFFPQAARASWLRDGVEVAADVSSTDVLANEDWSFQLHSYLELTPKRGERTSLLLSLSMMRSSSVLGRAGKEREWFDFSPVGRQGQTSSRLSEF
ncbi:hypothetical protein F2P81_016335 [Scophthalmus maximus]|uniref:Ig-like domain-containing protein n=1 Tax=Scophthalmus maximus TaxID=52904 RepID=A0A6A4SIQ6_SCOMX|nr:hypothetical protein F2P81_016335 [Scophthalmus maximus]